MKTIYSPLGTKFINFILEIFSIKFTEKFLFCTFPQSNIRLFAIDVVSYTFVEKGTSSKAEYFCIVLLTVEINPDNFKFSEYSDIYFFVLV